MATLKRPKMVSSPISFNAGQIYCRTLQGEQSAILSTFMKLPFVIKMFVLSIIERPFYTGFTVMMIRHQPYHKSMIPGHDSPSMSQFYPLRKQ